MAQALIRFARVTRAGSLSSVIHVDFLEYLQSCRVRLSEAPLSQACFE